MRGDFLARQTNIVSFGSAKSLSQQSHVLDARSNGAANSRKGSSSGQRRGAGKASSTSKKLFAFSSKNQADRGSRSGRDEPRSRRSSDIDFEEGSARSRSRYGGTDHADDILTGSSQARYGSRLGNVYGYDREADRAYDREAGYGYGAPASYGYDDPAGYGYSSGARSGYGAYANDVEYALDPIRTSNRSRTSAASRSRGMASISSYGAARERRYDNDFDSEFAYSRELEHDLEREQEAPTSNATRSSRRKEAREQRRRDRAKARAERMFAKQYDPASSGAAAGAASGAAHAASASAAGEVEGAPRAALYEAKMGSIHRKSARMQRALEASPQSAKINPSGWFSGVRVRPGVLRALTALVCLVLVGVFLYAPARQYYQAQREHDKLAVEYKFLEQRNETIDSQNDALSSNAGMEDAVRQKYGYVVDGDQTAVVTGLSDYTTNTARDYENIEANVLSSAVKAPEEWYTPYLDAFFGIE